MMSRRRGFLLVLCLLTATLVLLLGLGFLNGAAPRYSAAFQTRMAAQARNLAMAGMEDARVKLQKDPLFPPPTARDDRGQRLYTYAESLTDAGGNAVGSYVVTVDSSFSQPPCSVLVVKSRGLAGQNPASPAASYVLQAEFDVRPAGAAAHDRDANFARIVNWWEEGP